MGMDQVALEEVAIFDTADLDQRPQAIARVEPRHPRELLKAKIEGYVVLLFIIDEEGRVMDPRVESSSHPEFETAGTQSSQPLALQTGYARRRASQDFRPAENRFSYQLR